MQLWHTLGAIDQSSRLNGLRDPEHPDKREIPPVTGKTAEVNRLTEVSFHQINIRDETRKMRMHSFSDDYDEAAIRTIRIRNNVLGRRWVFFGKATSGLYNCARDHFNKQYHGDAEEGGRPCSRLPVRGRCQKIESPVGNVCCQPWN